MSLTVTLYGQYVDSVYRKLYCENCSATLVSKTIKNTVFLEGSLFYQSKQAQIEITANEGYQFLQSNYRINFYGTLATWTTFSFAEISEDKKTLTFYLPYTNSQISSTTHGEDVLVADGTITAEKGTITSVTNVTYDTSSLSNLTLKQEIHTFELNKNYTLTVEPNNYYKIENEPTATITNGDNAQNITAENGVFTFSFDSFNSDTITIKITGSGTRITYNEFPVTLNSENLSHYSIVNYPTSVEKNVDYTVKIKPDDFYYVNYNPKISIQQLIEGVSTTIIDSVSMTYNESENVYYYTFNVNNVDANTTGVSIVLSGSATYNKFNVVSFKNELENINVEPSTLEYIENHKTYKFTFTAIEGYEITSIPALTLLSRADGQTVVNQEAVTRDEETYTIEFTLNYDFTQGTEIYITVTGIATKITELSVTYPFLQVFSLTKSELTSLINTRFISVSTSGTAESPSVSVDDIDLSNYIIDLFTSYVPYEISDTKENIKLGVTDTGISANLIEKRYTVVQTNEIELKGLTGTSIDYNSIINMYLPFYGNLSLNAKEVLNRKISIRYAVENATGYATITIFADGEQIQELKCECKLEFPFNKTTDDSINIANKIKEVYNYDLIPFINVITNNLFSDGTDINPVNTCDLYLLLSQLSGYIEGDIYILSIDENYITNDEKNQIIDLIKQGIIV